MVTPACGLGWLALGGLRRWAGLGPPQLAGIAPASGLDEFESFSVQNFYVVGRLGVL